MLKKILRLYLRIILATACTVNLRPTLLSTVFFQGCYLGDGRVGVIRKNNFLRARTISTETYY